jgi:hypothetical protein
VRNAYQYTASRPGRPAVLLLRDAPFDSTPAEGHDRTLPGFLGCQRLQGRVRSVGVS